jgi:hypothetical protein
MHGAAIYAAAHLASTETIAYSAQNKTIPHRILPIHDLRRAFKGEAFPISFMIIAVEICLIKLRTAVRLLKIASSATR